MDIIIALPDKLYILRPLRNQDLITMSTEYNIYFRNIIYPFDDKWDIQVNCKYGRNYGNCWRIEDYSGDDNSFDMELVIYDQFGKIIASKKCEVCVADRKEDKHTSIMFIGDSMTQSQKYINHITSELYGIKTVGSRSIDGIVHHEGRGGWSFNRYFNAWYDDFGVSPFLYPVGVETEKYYGNKDFADDTRDYPTTYTHRGFKFCEVKDGQYYVKGKQLFRKDCDNEILVSEKPSFEFDFGKYLAHFELQAPEIVSILMGGNDLQVCAYEDSDERTDEFVNYIAKMTEAIHRYSSEIKIIINMPIVGADQYSWGERLGCRGGSKMYRYNVLKAADKILRRFDNRQNERIYISPMLACIDPVYGFPAEMHRANKYSEQLVRNHSNWVHPNGAGYCQMADALTGVIENIR